MSGAQTTEARRREKILKEVIALMHAPHNFSKNNASMEVGVSHPTISRWMRAYAAHGIAGLTPKVKPAKRFSSSFYCTLSYIKRNAENFQQCITSHWKYLTAEERERITKELTKLLKQLPDDLKAAALKTLNAKAR